MGQRIDGGDLGRTTRRKHMHHLALLPGLHLVALAVELQLHQLAVGAELQRAGGIAHRQHQATGLVAQRRLQLVAAKLKVKTALGHAMRLPAIAAAVGVVALGSALLQQLGHHGSGRSGIQA